MRKVSLIAAVFFAVAWLAVAEDAAPPVPPQYTPRPSTTPDAAPTWLTPQQFKPMPGMQSHTISTPTPDGSHLVTVTTTPIKNAAPTAAMWQIHRSDSDTLLLNAVTGETWFLDRSDKQCQWQPIARNPSLPVNAPAVIAPAATFPGGPNLPSYSPAPQDGSNEPPRLHPTNSTGGERPAARIAPFENDPAFQK